MCQKMWLKNATKKTFLGHFQKLETGSESMSRSVMASSFQKLMFEVDIKNMKEQREEKGREGEDQLRFGILTRRYGSLQPLFLAYRLRTIHKNVPASVSPI